MAYMRAALINFGVEDVPGLILGMIRMGVLTMPYDQLFLGMQYTMSVLTVGFGLCNIKHFINATERVTRRHAELAEELARATTEVDEFEDVENEEYVMLVELRRMLPGSQTFGRFARDVMGDLMLLRYLREAAQRVASAVGAEAVDRTSVLTSAAAAVVDALAERARGGADVIRERIMREDMVRAALETACTRSVRSRGLVLFG